MGAGKDSSATIASDTNTLSGNTGVSVVSATMVNIDSQGDVMVSGLKKTIITSSGNTLVQGTIVKLN